MHRLRARTAVHLLVVAGGLAATAVVGTEPSTNRPAVWAQPLTVTGVPNLHKVNDVLYRSAQPTAVGMRNLKRMGIKTVINLRSFHSDRDELGDSGLAHEHIPMKTWHPEKEDVVRFLRIVNDPARAPVLVHCQHGADRTGTLCALYRVAVEGWTKEAAVREMTAGGFGFHEVWQNLPAWIRDLDIESVRKAVGIATLGSSYSSWLNDLLAVSSVRVFPIVNGQDEHNLLAFINTVEHAIPADPISPGRRLIALQFTDIRSKVRPLAQLWVDIRREFPPQEPRRA